MITEKENTLNMERCPRFQDCSIPLCPLDWFMSDRVELPEDEKCILISSRGKKVIGNVRGNLKRIIGKYVWPQNRNANISLPPYVSGVKGSLGKDSDKLRAVKAD